MSIATTGYGLRTLMIPCQSPDLSGSYLNTSGQGDVGEAVFITEKRKDILLTIFIMIVKNFLNVRFQFLMAVFMKMTVFWDIALSSLVEVYLCFRGAYCLHHQGDE
jgi:hypothetical protein